MAETTVSGKQSLTAEAWMEAALDVIAAAGLQAVAVEPLARRLNVTKGSFYWHFASREALLEAALCRWEKRRYAETAALYEPEVPPRERLHRLLKTFANTGRRDKRVLMALGASDNATARAIEKRVSAHWADSPSRATGVSACPRPRLRTGRASPALSIWAPCLYARRARKCCRAAHSTATTCAFSSAC